MNGNQYIEYMNYISVKSWNQCCLIWTGLLTTLISSGIVYSTIEFSPYINQVPQTITNIHLFIHDGYSTLNNVDMFIEQGYTTYETVNTFLGNITHLQNEIGNITELAYPILENTRSLINNGQVTLDKINQISFVANRTLQDIQKLIVLIEDIINNTYIPTTAEIISDIYKNPQSILSSGASQIPQSSTTGDITNDIPNVPNDVPNLSLIHI